MLPSVNRHEAEQETCVSTPRGPRPGEQLALFPPVLMFNRSQTGGRGTVPPRALPAEKVSFATHPRRADDRPCGRCRRRLPRSSFTRRRASPDGLQPWCRECQSEHQRAYRQTPWGKAKHSESARLYRLDPSNALKLEARAAIQRAKRAGVLTAPEACEICGRFGPVLADHHRGYARAHHLDVRWICSRCDGSQLAARRTTSARRRRNAHRDLFARPACASNAHRDPKGPDREGGRPPGGKPQAPVSSDPDLGGAE